MFKLQIIWSFDAAIVPGSESWCKIWIYHSKWKYYGKAKTRILLYINIFTMDYNHKGNALTSIFIIVMRQCLMLLFPQLIFILQSWWSKLLNVFMNQINGRGCVINLSAWFVLINHTPRSRTNRLVVVAYRDSLSASAPTRQLISSKESVILEGSCYSRAKTQTRPKWYKNIILLNFAF